MKRVKPIDPQQLYRYLDGEAPQRLRTYFGSGTYTGGRFERFAGGGDRPAVKDEFTSDDIVAVSLLGVRIPGIAALHLVDAGAKDFGSLLSAVPNRIDLWDVEEEVVGPGSPAATLWRELDAIPYVGWVTAGKLLARKRPRLLPVYDRVVRAAMGQEDDWWLPLRDVLLGTPQLVTRLREVREEAGVGEDISLIRILDVSVWMRDEGQPEHLPEAEFSP